MAQSNNENGRWITTDTGSHVFIKKGQSVEEALSERFDEEESILKDSPKDKNNAIITTKENIQRKLKKNEKISKEELLKRAKDKYELTEEEFEELKKKLDAYLKKNNIEFDSFEEDSGIPEEKQENFKFKKYYYNYGDEENPDWREVDFITGSLGMMSMYDSENYKEEEVDFDEAGLPIKSKDITNLIDSVANKNNILSKGQLQDKFVLEYSNEVISSDYAVNPKNASFIKAIKESFSKYFDNKWNEIKTGLVQKGEEFEKGLKKTHITDLNNHLYNTNPHRLDYQYIGIARNEKKRKDLYYKYHHNCQRCAQTLEMRLRGYDVEATERLEEDEDWKNPNNLLNRGWEFSGFVEPDEGVEIWGNEVNSFRLMSGAFRSWKKNWNGELGGTGPSQLKNINKIISKQPNGSRFMIVTSWQGRGAHVFNAINDNGTVRLIDGQGNRNDVSYYFGPGSVQPSFTYMVRVDKLKISPNMKYMLKNREEEKSI